MMEYKKNDITFTSPPGVGPTCAKFTGNSWAPPFPFKAAQSKRITCFLCNPHCKLENLLSYFPNNWIYLELQIE